MFVVMDEKGNVAEGEYFSLDDAIEAAGSSKPKVVVVKQSGSLYTGDKELTDDGKYEFTIPSNITLLVPGDDDYTVRNSGVEKADEARGFYKPKRYSYLTLQDKNLF